VFFVEVDHPASQAWKLARLSALGLTTPGVKYVPVDFALMDWRSELAAAGVKSGEATFFAWLGVSQYIPEEANYETFRFVVAHGHGSEIVFDVIRPIEGLLSDERAISEAARVSSQERGEPWVTYLWPGELAARLASLGFTSVTRLTPSAALPYYVGQPADVTPLTAWELMSAHV
jgi:methyltransferase (TIGR00027 family)